MNTTAAAPEPRRPRRSRSILPRPSHRTRPRRARATYYAPGEHAPSGATAPMFAAFAVAGSALVDHFEDFALSGEQLA